MRLGKLADIGSRLISWTLVGAANIILGLLMLAANMTDDNFAKTFTAAMVLVAVLLDAVLIRMVWRRREKESDK